MAEAMVQAESLVKIYKTKETEVMALQGLDLTIECGELTAIIGNSGSGKSTFLNMIGGLDRPTVGSLQVCGRNLFTMTEKELVLYKRNTVGFVWQNNARNLLPYLSSIENVMLPMLIAGANAKAAAERAEFLLSRLKMDKRLKHRPSEMSGGEQQRVSIARALAKKPKLLLCDEPTGALDYETGKSILKLLQDTCRRDGMTVVIITHNAALAAMADRIIRVKSGHIYSVRMNEHITPVEQIEW